MTAIIAFITSNWRLLLGATVAIGVLAVWLYVGYLRNEIDTQAAQLGVANDALAQQQAVNAQNLVELARIQKEHQAALDAITKLQVDQTAKIQVITKTKWKVVNAPVSDDGPIANVLRDAFAGLRSAQANPGGGNPGSKAGDTGGAAHL